MSMTKRMKIIRIMFVVVVFFGSHLQNCRKLHSLYNVLRKVMCFLDRGKSLHFEVFKRPDCLPKK